MVDTVSENIEYYLVKQLLENDTFARCYLPNLLPSLFSVKLQIIVVSIKAYFDRLSKTPTLSILQDVLIPRAARQDEDAIRIANESLTVITSIQFSGVDVATFINDEMKKFIKQKTIMSAMYDCLPLLEKTEKHEEIVAIMEKAIRISFDETLGLDYFEDLETRLARADIISEVMTTGIPSLDNLVGGGYRRKSLFVYAGPGNVGKSLVLNDAALTLTLAGYNVAYLTLELSEDYISQRTDANFTTVSMNIINVNPREAIEKAIKMRDVMRKENKKFGKLMYKDYPPNAVSCNDVRGYLKTLEAKNGFKPDFIIVDYIKLLKANGKIYGDSLYNKLGTVAEELRALAYECNVCVLTASQTGRQSYGSASIGMEDVSDSIAIPQTADVLVTLARNTALNEEDKILLTLAKSRFSRNQGSIQVKIDYEHMKLIDVGQDSQHQEMVNNRQMVATPIKKRDAPKKSDNDDFNLTL